MTLPDVLSSLFAAAIISLLAVLVRGLSRSGGTVAFLLLSLIGMLGGGLALTAITLSFFLVALVGKAMKRRTAALIDGIHLKEGARDGVQVAVNGIPALLSAALCFATGEGCFLFAYYAAIAEALGDSLASDVGVLSRRAPRSVLTLKPVARGMSGGVSLLGSLSAFGGASLVAVLYFAFVRAGVTASLLIAAVAFVGVWLDSILGATLQVRYACTVCGKATEKTAHCGMPTEKTGGFTLCNNDTVNLLSGFATAVLAAFVGYFIL